MKTIQKIFATLLVATSCFVVNAQNQCPNLTTIILDNGTKITSVDHAVSPESEFLRCSFHVSHGEFDGFGSYITSNASFELITNDSERFFFMQGEYFDTAKEYEVILRDFTAPNKSTTICVASGEEAKQIIEQIR